MIASDSEKQQERRLAIARAMASIKVAMEAGPTIENLNQGKVHLIELAKRKDLFNFEEFPLPANSDMEVSYLVHECVDGSYSLYVNSGASHQYYAPHDHGDAWAIIAGVQGRERHKLYKRVDESISDGLLKKMGEMIVAPGEAVTMQPDGIHEVNAMDGKPLLHLHLYAKNFVLQGERWKYDLEKGESEKFCLDELGGINDER